MNQPSSDFYPAPSSAGAPPNEGENCKTTAAFLRNWSPQDWLVISYLLYLNLILLPKHACTGWGASAVRMASLLAFFLLVLVPVRARWLRDGFAGPLLYRTALQGTVQTSYFFFAAYLPLVNPKSLDPLLYSLDMRYFGFEPCLFFDRIMTPFSAEWFAFFYFCYFFILAIHTIPILLFARNERLLGEFSFGMLMLFCVGHTIYTLVPGFGPYRELAPLFQHPLPSGFWVDTVLRAVATGGAQKDIFPSLHTAAPTFIALFSFRNRAHLPFKYSWPIIAFFATNIVVATMFMRWHWLIDVVAGLTLATTVFGLSIVVTRYDLTRRKLQRLGPSWPVFTYVPGMRQRS